MDRKDQHHVIDRPPKIYARDSGPLPSRVHDISDRGAQLHIAWKGRLPNTFDLADAFTNTRRTVRVVWVGLSGAGVRFVDEGQWAALAKPNIFGRRQ